MLKLWKTALCAAGLSAFMAGAAYGGQWQQDDRGWRWKEEDGSYTAIDWSWIDGNRVGVSEWLYAGKQDDAGWLSGK